MTYVSGYDEPNGVIIGDFYTTWQLFYDGRPQGQKQYANSPDEAMVAARNAVEWLKAQFKCAPYYLYQNDALWIVRLQS